MKPGAWAAALVLTGACAGVVSADDWYSRGRHSSYRGYGYDTFRIGLDYGYSEGVREGRRDGERRREYRFSNDRRFRRADHGYRRSFGPRHEYARGFRAGYERGYRAGYETAIRYARGYGYSRYSKTGRYGRDRYRY